MTDTAVLTPDDVDEVLVLFYARKLHDSFCPTCFPGYVDPSCHGPGSGERAHARTVLLALAAEGKLLA